MTKQQVFAIILIVLCIDQCSKIYIKTHFELGQELVIFSWFKILFVENDGMAWGAKLSDFTSIISDKSAKLCLTIFRILALTGIGYWLFGLVKKGAYRFLILAVSLVFSGALGNILDSVFYGFFFGDSLGQKAVFFPDKGYSSLFYGNVVDMLHFPLYKGYFPDWFPFIGGHYFTFFNPVFNVADVAISIGVGLLILCNMSNKTSKKSSFRIDKSDLV
jgi:signal peptidase II